MKNNYKEELKEFDILNIFERMNKATSIRIIKSKEGFKISWKLKGFEYLQYDYNTTYDYAKKINELAKNNKVYQFVENDYNTI